MQQLRLERVVDAPPSAVFRACTDPVELAKWWGPHGFTAPSVELEPRVGGDYRIAMQPPDGDLFHLHGRFREVDAGERLVYTFNWDPPDPDDQEMVVTLTFSERGGDATQVVMTQTGFATEARRQLHEEGWTDSLERLATLLSSGQPQ